MEDKQEAEVRTFLIADVRGYTRYTQEHGDEAAGALAARFADIAEGAVTDLGGRLLELRGDEALAVFSSARSALRAAVELQRRLRAPDDGSAPFPVGVGIGLDSGEAVPVEGGYRGGALNLAARLCSTAGPGQILASQTVTSLSRHVEGLQFVPRRPTRLKGLAEPVASLEIVPESPLPPVAQATTSQRHTTPRRTVLLFGAVLALAVAAAGVAWLSRPKGLEGVAANSIGIIDAAGRTISAQLSIDGRPGGVAVGAGDIWVTDEVAGTLMRIDPAEQIVVDTIQVGEAPAGVAVGAGAVWVANSESHNVSQVNPESGTVVATIPVGNGPVAVAVSDGAVWVANATDGTISRIDPAKSRTIATVSLPQPPSSLAAQGDEVWATSAQGGLLFEVDPGTNVVAQTLPVGNGPTGVALGDGAVWVANGPDKTVSRVDSASGAITKINVTGEPEAVAFDGDILWAASSLTGVVSAIDIESDQVQSTIQIGSDSRGLAIEGDRVWVATLGAADAHHGGTLRVVLEGGEADTFDSIDPGVTYRSQAWQLLSLVHDGLVAFRRDGGPVGGTLVPDLAAAIPAPQHEGKTYTFRLRDGITYSTGDPVRAQDFRRAIEREFEFSTGLAASETDLLGAEECGRHGCDLSRGIVTDDAAGTVTFHLATPDPEFLYKLALPWGAPVPSGSSRPSYPGKPVPGTGAYMIRSYVPDRRLVLTRNPHFEEWSEEAQPVGYVDRMVWTFGLDPS
ncbi:MAG TPA: ABC transporter substrate-binding protein, partial [Actinomycetota bacterium]|nr:ABC transporter substrate-binding protein [Actinomycetota bacterium]